MKCLALLFVAAIAPASRRCAAQETAITVQKDAAGLVMHHGDETMHVSVCGPTVLHVVAGPGDPKGASPFTPWLLHPCEQGQFEFSQNQKEATLRTSALQVAINLKNSVITFRNAAGDQLLTEMDAPITLRIYRGGDADFTLYEDEGDSYAYEKGGHATIALHWDEATSTLGIGAREGSYPDMPKTRTFRVVLVGKDKGTGPQIEANPDKEIQYDGAAVTMPLQ
jgi:hypothetical protein